MRRGLAPGPDLDRAHQGVQAVQSGGVEGLVQQAEVDLHRLHPRARGRSRCRCPRRRRGQGGDGQGERGQHQPAVVRGEPGELVLQASVRWRPGLRLRLHHPPHARAPGQVEVQRTGGEGRRGAVAGQLGQGDSPLRARREGLQPAERGPVLQQVAQGLHLRRAGVARRLEVAQIEYGDRGLERAEDRGRGGRRAGHRHRVALHHQDAVAPAGGEAGLPPAGDATAPQRSPYPGRQADADPLRGGDGPGAGLCWPGSRRGSTWHGRGPPGGREGRGADGEGDEQGTVAGALDAVGDERAGGRAAEGIGGGVAPEGGTDELAWGRRIGAGEDGLRLPRPVRTRVHRGGGDRAGEATILEDELLVLQGAAHAVVLGQAQDDLHPPPGAVVAGNRPAGAGHLTIGLRLGGPGLRRAAGIGEDLDGGRGRRERCPGHVPAGGRSLVKPGPFRAGSSEARGRRRGERGIRQQQQQQQRDQEAPRGTCAPSMPTHFRATTAAP